MTATGETTDQVALGFTLAFAGALIYGSTAVFGSALVADGVSGTTAIGIRFLGSALLLFPLVGIVRKPWLPVRGERLPLFLFGAIVYTANSLLLYAALGQGDAGIVTVLSSLFPAFVIIIEIAAGLRPRAAVYLGLVLCFGGTSLIALVGSGASITVLGIVLATSSAVLYAIALYGTGRIVKESASMTKAAWMSLWVGLTSIVIGLIAGDLAVPASAIDLLAGNAAASAATYVLLFMAMSRVGAAPTSVITNLYSVSAIALGWLFLAQVPTTIELVAAAIIIVGATVVTLGERKTDRQPLRQR